MIFEEEMIHGRLPRSRSARWHGSSRRDRLSKRAAAGDWDQRAYRDEVLEESHPAARPPSPVRARIEDDTPIVPAAVARGVCEEASSWLGEALPRDWALELAERANVIYQHNGPFRRRLRAAGNAGRDLLWSFTRHWLCALLASRRPDLAARLPSSYAAGQNLPPREQAVAPRLKPTSVPSSVSFTA